MVKEGFESLTVTLRETLRQNSGKCVSLHYVHMNPLSGNSDKGTDFNNSAPSFYIAATL